jgi:hypothetical protein
MDGRLKTLLQEGGTLETYAKKAMSKPQQNTLYNLPEIFARCNRTSTLWGMRCITDGNGKD